MGDIAAAAEAAQTGTIDRALDSQQKSTLLLFRAGTGSPKAVPLASIARLEEFDRRQIETVTGHHVIQYRGALTPLVSFDPLTEPSAEGRQPALVFTYQGRVVALLVDEIVDIVETDLNIHHGRSQPGIIGSAIIAGRATELIDADYFCRQAFEPEPHWFGDEGELRAPPPASATTAPEPKEMAVAA
jgi:two-component system, chemotaxis family, sensor kinase CheA